MGKLSDKIKNKGEKVEKEESSSDLLEYYSKFKSDKKKAKKTTKEIQENSNQTDFIKIPDGETRLRFLPPKNIKEDNSYVIQTTHSINGSKDGKKSFVAINCTGDENCFGCQAVAFLQKTNNTESKELIQGIKAKTRFLFSAYDREHDKVGIFSAPPTLATQIITPLSYNEPFDINNGQDFIVVKNTKASSPAQFYAGSNYISKSSKLIKSGITKDMSAEEKAEKKEIANNKIMEILKKIPDLTLLVKGDPEDKIDKFKEILEMNLGSKMFRKLEDFIEGEDIDEEEKTSASIGDDDDIEEYIEKSSKSKSRKDDDDEDEDEEELDDEDEDNDDEIEEEEDD